MAQTPPKKTLSLKTRLLLILIVFITSNFIFYVAFDSSDSESEIRIDPSEQEITNDGVEEKQYPKFNPSES